MAERDKKPAPTPAVPLPAASVVILRDGADGMEVFMLQRPEAESMAFAGALVFPGGKVDAADAEHDWHSLAAPTPAVPDRAYWVASVRETFEEAGFLLARRPHATGLVDAAMAERIVLAERAKSSRPTAAAFAEMIRREDLILATDQMIHFGHWITPRSRPRRFDTHFFLAAAPMIQVAAHDEIESAEAMWIRPQDALREYDEGKRQLVAVTHFTLSLLASWNSAHEAVVAARKRRVMTVEPTATRAEGGRLVRIPAEAGYLATEFLMRGE